MINPEELLKHVQEIVGKLNALEPKKWKGNDAPSPHHFDAGSIKVSANANLAAQQVNVAFTFTDGGVRHGISASVPIEQLGRPGPNEDILLDSGVMSDGDFILSQRTGFDSTGFYTRIVCEFKFTDPDGVKHDYRFDGAVVGNV